MNMNQATKNFVARLENDDNVLGVILFGSWARGNNRAESDVDLIILLKKGFQRCIETHDGQIFEIIYTTPGSALQFWQENKDECFKVWSVAKILLDKGGVIEQLQQGAKGIIDTGKTEINEKQKEQFRFDAEDKLRYIKISLTTDLVTASLILNQMVIQLTGLYFDLRRQWTPAPKQRFAEIESKSPLFADLLKAFYETDDQRVKLEKAEAMVPVVFGDSSSRS
jgi:hypothetical protein